MKNIDEQLIKWAINNIKTNYLKDVDLLIGQTGACKSPEDEQSMAFDFFVPATERGNQMAQTFIIEDMGYDLYPISWERLQDITDLKEPRMIFALMKGGVIYSRNEGAVARYWDMKRQLKKNLEDKTIVFHKALEFINTAMEIYQTMMFEDDLCAVRKASGGIACYLMNAIAMVNGRYLKNGYLNLSLEMSCMEKIPEDFKTVYDSLIRSKNIEEIQSNSHRLIKVTRDMFIAMKPIEEKNSEDIINYDDLADWYQEARYSFRRIEYYIKENSAEDCFLMGCYLQIEFDAIRMDFNLEKMDLLGDFDTERLNEFDTRAKQLENYILSLLHEHHANIKIYHDFNEFLHNIRLM